MFAGRRRQRFTLLHERTGALLWDMRPWLAAVLALAFGSGCGRIGFDPFAGATGDAVPGGDGAVVHDAALPGLVLWLEMETDPPVIVDSASGHTVSCSVTGSCPKRSTGLHGSGYQFSKSSSLLSLTVAYRADLDPRSGYSIAAWVLLAPANDYLCALTEPYVSGSNPDFDTFAMCDDGLGGGCAQNDVYWNADPGPQTCGPNLANSMWHHVVLTWDGTTQKTYSDGILNSSFPLASVSFDGSDLRVGGDLDGALQPAFFWSGTIDDVMWFDRALAQNEIIALATP